MALHIRTPDAYASSLRDGRRVFYRGERVTDVPGHPELSLAVRHAATDFALAEDPNFRDLALTSDGYSRYFEVPRSSAELLHRSRLIEAATREGRTLVVLVKEIGTDALFALMSLGPELGEPYANRVREFFDWCRSGDLAMAVAQTDVKGDRSLGPSQQPDPDAYLRIVERRSDGIVVRGAKVHTSVSVNANELIVLPTRAMSEADAAYAVAFAIPVDTEGLRLVCSPYLSHGDRPPEEFPISGTRKMVETTTMFEDVFVPNDRIFLAGETRLAGEIARRFVEFHRFTAISYKLPLVDALVGSAMLAASFNGIDRVGHVRNKLAWLVSYAETLRALTHHAAERCEVVNGIAVPDTLLVNIAKLQFAEGLHQAFHYVQDIAGGLLVTYPSTEDLKADSYGPALVKYFAAGDRANGEERLRLTSLITDLTVGEYGGYQAVLAVHAEGSIEAEKLTILSQYRAHDVVEYTRWLAGLPATSAATD